MQLRVYDIMFAQIMGVTASGGRQDWQAGCLRMSRGLYLSPRVSSWLCRSLLCRSLVASWWALACSSFTALARLDSTAHRRRLSRAGQ